MGVCVCVCGVSHHGPGSNDSEEGGDGEGQSANTGQAGGSIAQVRVTAGIGDRVDGATGVFWPVDAFRHVALGSCQASLFPDLHKFG